MKKAVIECGGVQHLVEKGESITVNYVGDVKTVNFTPLMIVDGKNSIVDAKKLEGMKVSAKVTDEKQGEKVMAIRYKSKKRVHTLRGHRQKLSTLEITSLS